MSLFKVSDSSLRTSALCSTKTGLSYGLQLTTDTENMFLKSGAAMHIGLAEFHREGNRRAALTVFEETYRTWADNNLESTHRLSFVNLFDILDAYCIKYGKPGALPFKIAYLGEQPAVELDLRVPLNTEFQLHAVIDALVFLPSNSLAVLDHKTTGRVDRYWSGGFSVTSQFTGYTFAIETKYNMPVSDVLINALETSRLPIADKKCKVHGVPFIECRKAHMKQEFLQYNRDPWQVEEWKRHAIALAEIQRNIVKFVMNDPDKIKRLRQEGLFNDHCKWCEFLEICRAKRTKEAIKGLLVPRVRT